MFFFKLVLWIFFCTTEFEFEMKIFKFINFKTLDPNGGREIKPICPSWIFGNRKSWLQIWIEEPEKFPKNKVQNFRMQIIEMRKRFFLTTFPSTKKNVQKSMLLHWCCPLRMILNVQKSGSRKIFGHCVWLCVCVCFKDVNTRANLKLSNWNFHCKRHDQDFYCI